MENSRTDIERLAKLIHGIEFAMLTTTSVDDGALRSRPMTLQNTPFDGELWFFVGRSTSQAQDVAEDAQVNLAFAEPKDNTYISVSGQAEVVFDREQAAQMWNPILKAWFPQGLEDPELALLRVHVESADIWDSPSSKVVQLVGFAKAILTGKRADSAELGDRRHITM